MNRKQKSALIRIIISLVLLIAIKAAFAFSEIICDYEIIAYLIPYAIIGWDVLWKAIRNILRGQVFDENFLMAIATIGAMFTGEYIEGAAVMLFYQVGELFQSCAVGRSRKSIASLMNIRPDHANIERDGKLETVSPENVNIGDTIVIKPGEKIPLDGVILDGSSTVDTAALTGESVPRDVLTGDDVVSGCINLSGVLKVRVTKRFGESTVAKILDLVENTGSQKAKSENFITKFARYYTPCVVAGAVLLAVLPPLIAGGDWASWIHRALIFLVISCPCALVISVPLSFFGGIGGASRCGVLVKGGNYLEALSKTEIIVFDKTGTLTKGVFNVTAIHPDIISESELLEYAALAEHYSNHPISRSLKDAYDREIDTSRISDYVETAGRGVRAKINSAVICAGNNKYMDEIGVKWHPCHHVGTTVHVAVNGEYAGHIVISDEVKSDAKDAISSLKKHGIKKAVMLTGDSKETAESIAASLGIDEVYSELMPADKVSR